MAALAPVQSLLHLDDALVAIPEDAACCSTSQPAAPARWVDHERLLAAHEGRMRPLRKCASVPTLHSMQEACGDGEGMEVYVILRPFKVRGLNAAVGGWRAATCRAHRQPAGHQPVLSAQCGCPAMLLRGMSYELAACLQAPHLPPAALRRRCAAHPRCHQEFGGGLFRRLPKRVKNGVRDCGLCHYLAVFKQKDGSLVQVRRAYYSMWLPSAVWMRGCSLRQLVECWRPPIGAAGALLLVTAMPPCAHPSSCVAICCSLTLGPAAVTSTWHGGRSPSCPSRQTARCSGWCPARCGAIGRAIQSGPEWQARCRQAGSIAAVCKRCWQLKRAAH